MSGWVDYYELLGVSSRATVGEIRSAYRSLARRYHPDTSEEEHMTEMFRDIHKAYLVLADPEQRAAYDSRHMAREPGRDSDGEIEIEILTSHETLRSVREPQVFYVILDVMPGGSAIAGAVPLNLCLVLDHSTSMKGQRLHKVKEAAREIVDLLRERDVLSLVAFSDRARVIAPAQSGANRAQAKGAIASILAQGGTEIFQGLQEGVQQIGERLSNRRVNHIILLTDGQTYGDEDQCLDLARQAHAAGVGISTVGIGSDWNDSLLDEICERSGGSSHYLEGPGEIGEFFRHKVQQLADAFVQGTCLTVLTDGDVSLRDGFRISPVLSLLPSSASAFDLGTISTRTGQSILLEMVVPPRPAGEHRLACFRVTGSLFSKAGGDEDCTIEREIVVRFVDEAGSVRQPPERMISVLRSVSLYRMQQKAFRDAEEGRVQEATERLEAMATRLLGIGEMELARSALTEIDQLARTGSLSPEGRKKLKYGTRGLASGKGGSAARTEEQR